MKRAQAATGAVTLIQRFGSAANLNIHLHCLVLDGVYCTTEGTTVFHPVRAPSAEQLQILLNQIIKRLMRLLTRRGYLIEEQDMLCMAETDTAPAIGRLHLPSRTRAPSGPESAEPAIHSSL